MFQEYDVNTGNDYTEIASVEGVHIYVRKLKAGKATDSDCISAGSDGITASSGGITAAVIV